MSRGPGQVQRAIMAAFAAEPDNAFLLCELCERVYPGVNRIEKKHRVAVARAANAIKTLDHWKRETLGGELVFYDPLNVMSYAVARLKSDSLGPGAAYRNNDYRPVPRRTFWGRDITSYRQYDISSDKIFREMLAPGGEYHKDIVEGGAWWLHTEMHRAEKRGDRKTLKRLQAEQEHEIAKLVASFRSISPVE
jgi:hypothetical protein